jgi:hypothetical protein
LLDHSLLLGGLGARVLRNKEQATRHFLLDKAGFFYLRWGVYEALRKHVQGGDTMESKVKRTPGENTDPPNGAATGEEYGA